MKTLRDSFKDYISVETLDGENKYMAEGHGLQDAKKGIVFTSFPPVLHLQLKRFEYDMQRDTMVKVCNNFPNGKIWLSCVDEDRIRSTTATNSPSRLTSQSS